LTAYCLSSIILDVNRQTPILDGVERPITTKGTGTALLLDIQDAADFLGLSPWQIRGLVTADELKVVRVGRKFYFRKQALVRWAERAEE
jgi:excisionase family DNA binding protein